MAAVGRTFNNTLEADEMFLEYKGHLIVKRDDPKSRARNCRDGLRNTSMAMRRAVVPAFVEDCFEALSNQFPSLDTVDGKFEKLTSVVAVGIGDGCSHSMALVSRNKRI